MFIHEPPPPPPVVEEHVTPVLVTARGVSPVIESGILMTAVLILTRTEDGRTTPFFVPFMSADRAYPALGSRCTFHHRSGQPDMVGGLEMAEDMSGQIVSRFDCDSTTALQDP